GEARLLSAAMQEHCRSSQLRVVVEGEQTLALVGEEGTYTTAQRPALMLLDLTLPKLDGRVVLQRLRTSPEWNTIPLLILAGRPQDVDDQQAAALQVERFLQKPADWAAYQALGKDLATRWQLRASSTLRKKG